jgi:hypothetical protein
MLSAFAGGAALRWGKSVKDGNKLGGLEPDQMRRQLAKTLRSPL